LKTQLTLSKLECPRVQAMVVIPGKNDISVSFIVDTGAQISLLSDEDANRLGARFEDLPHHSKGVSGVGGSADIRELRGHIIILLPCENSKVLEIDLPNGIAVLKRKEPKEKINRKSGTVREYKVATANLFGVDLLGSNKLALNCNFNTLQGYIENG
jgi:hypothetical protein